VHDNDTIISDGSIDGGDGDEGPTLLGTCFLAAAAMMTICRINDHDAREVRPLTIVWVVCVCV